jgi:two-component system LytT family sensor kinase
MLVRYEPVKTRDEQINNGDKRFVYGMERGLISNAVYVDKCRIDAKSINLMQLTMKAECERCGRSLVADGEAFICSYECTFCPTCFSDLHGTCANCGGELSRRPQRRISLTPLPDSALATPISISRRMVWGLSFGVWGILTFFASVWIYQYDRSVGSPMHFWQEISLQLSDVFSYALLTPFVIALALRYPLKKSHWLRPGLALLGGGLLFTLGHVILRGATYPVWDPGTRDFLSVWNTQAHPLQIRWYLFKRLLMIDWFNDIAWTYAPIVVVAYTVSYYQKFRERELRTSHLEVQLAKAHLQSLKSQLRPHFLFNTMHSISALMLTDVRAADRMMSRLSELLRLSLEEGPLQMTTLNRELEFVEGYLEIEKVRFEDRLNVHQDIADDTLDAEVPHLLLQPLVENAVRHGIAKRSSRGELRIRSRCESDSLLLYVTDNGPGIVESTSSGQKSGLGLRATRERLQTLYGDRQSFSIQNLTEGGVEVCVRIPFRVEPRPSIYEIVSENVESTL